MAPRQASVAAVALLEAEGHLHTSLQCRICIRIRIRRPASERRIGAFGSRSAAIFLLFLRPPGISKHTRNIKAGPFQSRPEAIQGIPGSEF